MAPSGRHDVQDTTVPWASLGGRRMRTLLFDLRFAGFVAFVLLTRLVTPLLGRGLHLLAHVQHRAVTPKPS